MDPEDTTSVILLTSSILPSPVIITETRNGSPTTRTIHPPPSPYSGPTSTAASTSGQPPATITWTSAPSTATPCSLPPCDLGVRCVGLFCDLPCLLVCPKLLDPDWWDPVDPNSPWPNSAPWEPEDEACTTTSASSCATECLATGTTTTCDSTCSVSYGCSATSDAASTLGTYTLAPWGYMTYESWDTASDDDPAFTSSVFASVSSEMQEWYPTTTTSTSTSTTAPDAPAATTGGGLGDACTSSSQCTDACGNTSGSEGCSGGVCVCNKDPPPPDAACGDVAICNEWYACTGGQTMSCTYDEDYLGSLCTCSDATSKSSLVAGSKFYYSHVWPVATTNETISGQPGWLDLTLANLSSTISISLVSNSTVIDAS